MWGLHRALCRPGSERPQKSCCPPGGDPGHSAWWWCPGSPLLGSTAPTLSETRGFASQGPSRGHRRPQPGAGEPDPPAAGGCQALGPGRCPVPAVPSAALWEGPRASARSLVDGGGDKLPCGCLGANRLLRPAAASLVAPGHLQCAGCWLSCPAHPAPAPSWRRPMGASWPREVPPSGIREETHVLAQCPWLPPGVTRPIAAGGWTLVVQRREVAGQAAGQEASNNGEAGVSWGLGGQPCSGPMAG